MFTPVSAGGTSYYDIPKSLRFRSGASAYLSRVFSGGNPKDKVTLSFWIKRGKLGTAQRIYQANSGTAWYATVLEFTAADKLHFFTYYGLSTTIYGWTTTRVFRDPNAPIHIQLSIDTSLSGQASRRLWINGVEESSFTAETSGYNTVGMNHYLCYSAAGGDNTIGGISAGTYLDAYLSEFNAVVGQAYSDASYFGYLDTQTNSWKPKKYTGTYGDYGFHLPFDDGSSLAALGQDRSGNGNNWTCNGVSLTAGPTYDWMDDTPSNNFCALNPLNTSNAPTLADGHLSISGASTGYRSSIGTLSITKPTYFEVVIGGTTGSSRNGYFGVASNPNALAYTSHPGSDSTGWSIGYSISTYYVYHNNAYTVPAGTPVAGAVLRVAVDPTSGKIWFAINDTWVSGNPATGDLPTYSNIPSEVWPIFEAYQTGPHSVNFGQRPFAFAPPSGFKALCTKNLPEPTGAAKNPKKHFDAVPYVGNGGTKNVTGSAFQPSLVWMKNRGAVYGHHLVDSVRGVGKHIFSNATDAEYNYGAVGVGLTSFDAGGFSIAGAMEANYNANSYISWLWKAGSAPVANTAGSIASQVSVNVEAGFSIVTYTGIGTAGTVGHGLGLAPKFIIVKSRDGATTSWYVYHASSDASPQGQYLLLNGNDAKTASTSVWNSTQPTSSVFSIGTSASNTSGQSYVAYCFAEIPGYSKFGSFIGNSSTDGPFVYCGFKPAFILIKVASTTSDWLVFDTKRNTFNTASSSLYPNLSAAEATNLAIDVTTTGFKVRYFASNYNLSGATNVFYAIAEQPLKYANAR